jgi:hypothetical protein
MPETTSAFADVEQLVPDLPTGAALMAGAILGGLGGFLFLTSRGAQVRHDLTSTASRLLQGLDAALDGWAQLQRHGDAWRRGDTVDIAAARAASRTGGTEK